MIKAETTLEEVKIEVKAKDSTSNIRCRYFNKGYCKNIPDCYFDHTNEDCEQYIASGKCKDISCIKRHRKICKYWESKDGCYRGRDCEYLHEDFGERNTKESTKEQVQNSAQEKCDACNFDYFEKDQMKLHKIKQHRFKLCLQCDDTIKTIIVYYLRSSI